MVLSEQQKIDIICLKRQNFSNVAISKHVKCGVSAVRRFWLRYQQDKSLRRRAGSGRRRKTTDRDNRLIARMALNKRFITGSEIASQLASTSGLQISKWTVNRRLKEAGLQARRPAKKPLLTKK